MLDLLPVPVLSLDTLPPAVLSWRRRLTPEQRAAASRRQRERRHAIEAPRVPMTPEEYRLKRLAAAKAKREAFNATFVGPCWPTGLRKDHAARETPAIESRTARASQRTLGLSEATAAGLETASDRREARKAQRTSEREGRAWDALAARVIRDAWRTSKAAARAERKRAYAVEQARRRRLTPEQRDAELAANRAKAEAIRIGALGPLAAQERQRLAEAKAAAQAAQVARDTEDARRRQAALADASALAASITPPRPVGRVAFTPTRRT